MGKFFGKQRECSRFHDSLENNAAQLEIGIMPAAADGMTDPALRAHVRQCADCQAAAEELRISQSLLRRLPSQAAAPAPWFAARVMRAIAAREAEMRRSLDTWSIVPRLAAQLSWVSLAALLLAGTWLYQRPTPSRSARDSSFESLFEAPASSSSADDVLLSHLETE